MKIFSATLKGTTTVSQGTTNLSGSFTGSYSGSVAGIAGDISDYSSSVALRATSLEAASGSFSTRTTALEAASGSFSTRTTAIERVYATTGSNTFTAAQIIQGTLTAQTLVVQTVTSSVLFSTGSNKIGSSLSNVQELTGSVGITGSLAVVTTGTEFQVNAGGVNIGNALTDNHIISGSVTINPNGLFVSSSGNVGVGNTSPTVALDVTGAGKFSGASTFLSTVTAGSSLTGTNTIFRTNDATGYGIGIGYVAGSYGYITSQNATSPIVLAIDGVEKVRLTSAGNVGIGTITSTVNSLQKYLSITDNYNVGIILNDTRAASAYELFMAGSVFYINYGTSNKFNISAAGNVGIGTSTPAVKLNTFLSSDLSTIQIRAESDTSSVLTYLGISAGTIEYSRPAITSGLLTIQTKVSAASSASGGGAIVFSPNGTVSDNTPVERMRILMNGNVGIGTSSPDQQLTIGGFATIQMTLRSSTTTGSGEIYFGDSDSVNRGFIGYFHNGDYMQFNTAGSERLRIHATGYLLSVPTYNNTTGAAANMLVLSDGQLCRSTSSLKYKKEIKDYDKGLEIIKQMRPVYYKGISENDGNTQYAGLIAEEIHDLGLIEFVQYAKDGTPDALSYQNMIALAVKAIQELSAENTSLINRIEALENK